MGLIVGFNSRLIIDGGVMRSGASMEEYAGTESPHTFIASKGKLKSLIRYGKCEQSDTPTPESPVNIKCNNGALRMVDDELPAGYRRLLGFSMNNNAYWEIPDFPMYGSDTLRFSFEASDACNVIGAYSGSASGNNYSMYVSTSANYLRYKNGAYNSAVNFNTRYDVEITPMGSSGMKTDSTWTAQTFTTPTNLCIGTTAVTASSAKLRGKLYRNIEVVGRAKFIPCERISDNALGYYDTIGGAFHGQASGFDGAVSLGYDRTHYRLEVVGTPEVITLSAVGVADQTVTVENLFAVGNVRDEQDVISGTVTRRCGVCVYDGTQQVGDTFISMTGEKTVGTIIVYLLGEPVVEHVTPQPLTTQEGYNTLTIEAEVSSPSYKIVYKKK